MCWAMGYCDPRCTTARRKKMATTIQSLSLYGKFYEHAGKQNENCYVGFWVMWKVVWDNGKWGIATEDARQPVERKWQLLFRVYRYTEVL